jgi:asparagine synthase (glutamine-hydrolysing)
MRRSGAGVGLMCGIAVALSWPGAARVVCGAIQAMLHRGDVTDELISPVTGSAFCTRRLRIVDPEHNRQPATSWDGRILVAFNGEIYNHGILRDELASHGVPFRTEGDAELLAAALSVWGGRALQRLSGMYAFVALDLGSGEFLAARDPLGIKPLYVLRLGEGWLFASEIAPLLHASEEGEVHAVPAGAFMTRRRLGRHFVLPSEAELRAAPTPQQLDATLSEAVERHLPSDLPVATFLSGGIDSTLIAHYARRLRPEAPGYFLGGSSSPDFPYAAAFAERSALDLRLVELPSSPDDLEQVLPDLAVAVEAFEPEVLREAYCNWLLAQAVQRDGYRVVLAGEGADELFAGYRPLEVGFAHSEAAGRDLRRQTLEQMGQTNLQRLDRCTMRFQVERECLSWTRPSCRPPSASEMLI